MTSGVRLVVRKMSGRSAATPPGTAPAGSCPPDPFVVATWPPTPGKGAGAEDAAGGPVGSSRTSIVAFRVSNGTAIRSAG